MVALQVSPAEGNVSFERYASAGRALSESYFTMSIVHRSALTQHHTAAAATLTHIHKHFKLAYHVHCQATLYIQSVCLACLFVTVSNAQGSAL